MSLVERMLIGSDGIPPHVAVGSPDPQSTIRVTIHGLGGAGDATKNAVIVSLRPLLIAVGFKRDALSASQVRSSRPWFEFRERTAADELLGRIDLQAAGVVRLPEHEFFLFRAAGFQNYCIGATWHRRYYLSEWWKFKRKPDPNNFYMEPLDLFSLIVFYTCPRPVVLITTMHEGQGNIFPMDLIGPTATPYFLLALRTTSPSTPMMRDSRKIVMSSIPFGYTQYAYQLGVHHTKSDIDWAGLPFEVFPSSMWAFPVPKAALRVWEVRVVQSLVIGSHDLLVTTIEAEHQYNSGNAMHHIQGFYEQRLRRGGQPPGVRLELPAAPVTF